VYVAGERGGGEELFVDEVVVVVVLVASETVLAVLVVSLAVVVVVLFDEAAAVTVSDELEGDSVTGTVVVALRVEVSCPAFKNPSKAKTVPTARITKIIAVRARGVVLFKRIQYWPSPIWLRRNLMKHGHRTRLWSGFAAGPRPSASLTSRCGA